MIEARQRVTLETSVEGLKPGESVTVEFDHDPAAVELVLIPTALTPPGRWRSFVKGWCEGRNMPAT
jgi:hypothetical protein